MMTKIKLLYVQGILLLALMILTASPLSAKTIVGFGMSQQSGGLALNKELALARANDFLSQQSSIATFVYRKVDNKVSFERFLQAKLTKVQIAKREILSNNGVAIWLKAEATIPSYADERCQPVKESLSKGKESDRLLMAMLEKSIPDLLKSSLKRGRELKGLSYLRKLEVDKSWLGTYTITAEVCVAQVKRK